MSISLWTSAGVVRRLKAICQSLSKTNAILRVYDINSFTPDDEIMERVLELVNDAHVAWPTQCVADNAKQERGGKGVWRFVFDQEGPTRGLPHHAADLMYLFDNIQLPKSAGAAVNMDLYFEGPYDLGDEDEDMHCVSAGNSHLGALTLEDIRLAAITSWQNVRLSLVGGRVMDPVGTVCTHPTRRRRVDDGGGRRVLVRACAGHDTGVLDLIRLWGGAMARGQGVRVWAGGGRARG